MGKPSNELPTYMVCADWGLSGIARFVEPAICAEVVEQAETVRKTLMMRRLLNRRINNLRR